MPKLNVVEVTNIPLQYCSQTFNIITTLTIAIFTSNVLKSASLTEI